MNTLDPNENPEGYILHLEDLLRERQRTIKDLEWKLREVARCVSIQEECATTALAHAERVEAQNRELVTEVKIRDGVISDLQNRLAAFEDAN